MSGNQVVSTNITQSEKSNKVTVKLNKVQEGVCKWHIVQ